MAKFRIQQVAELARQLEFTPAETRAAQLTSAEELLLALEPGRAYPFDFIVFKITGYHPKSPVSDLFTGMALQHDLGLLIDQVSNSLDLKIKDITQPILQIDDVCERFNVTSKTIQRWRRRGLPGRRFIFKDGKRRVGFLLTSVERFLAAHRDQVDTAANFSQVSEEEKIEILRRAKRLATRCGCCRNEITRRIAKTLNRSPLTILHTIKKHDAEQPSDAIFPQASETIADAERIRILKAYRSGVAIGTLAHRVCRPKTAVYRVLIEERVARINRRKIKFLDDSLYHQDNAEQLVNDLVSQQTIQPSAKLEETRIPKDLPPYLQELYRTSLLTPAKERALFLKFNLHKYQFAQARRKLDPQFARSRQLNELEQHLRKAIDTKNAIVRANLRLVVSVARKHLRPWLSLMELISDGNLILMRAVDSFDVHKGYRFSTYATLALMKGYARSVPLMKATAAGTMGLEDDLLLQVPDAPSEIDRSLAARDELQTLLGRLSSREREVILSHYGVSMEGQTRQPVSYDELGERLGLSKQRIRQIEQSAMEKLRALKQEN
jgi:RNA polymerase sigma factor (sigma-70 family)